MITFGYKTKFSSLLRALSAIGIGAVMIFSNNATVTLVRIIAAFLFAAGVISFAYGAAIKRKGAFGLMTVNALVDIVAGLLMFFFPEFVAGFIVYLIGIALIGFGVLQLVVLLGTMSLIGMGVFSLVLSALAIIGGITLLFSPFGVEVMSIIAGCLLIVYGVSELLSAWRVDKAVKTYEIKFGPGSGAETGSKTGPKTDLDSVKDVEYRKIDEQ